MRIYSNLEEATSDTKRCLWEMGLTEMRPRAYKTMRPHVYQVVHLDANPPLIVYDQLKEGDKIRLLLNDQLPNFYDEFKDIFKKGQFIEVKAVFPNSPAKFETETIISRFLYERNGKINMAINTMSVDFYTHYLMTLAMSVHFQKAFAEAVEMKVGSVYHFIHDLYAEVERMEKENIH